LIAKFFKIYYNIKLKLSLRNFKKLIGLRNLVKGNIFIRIRKLGKFQTYGHNDENDNDIHYITNHILEIEENKNKEEKLKDLILICRQDEKLLQLFDLYIKIDDLIHSALDKKNKMPEFNPKKPLLENIETLSLKKIKKALSKFIKADLNEIIDRSTFKIDITVQETLSYITLISTLIFCGGYIYNTILFKLYGIDASFYFGISDYISAAIKQINLAFIGGIFALFGFFRSLVNMKENIGYFKDKNVIKKTEKESIKLIILFFLFYIIFSYRDIKYFYEFLFIPVILLFNFILDKFLFPHLKSTSRALSILLFSSVFFGLVISNAIGDYYLNEKDENVKLNFTDKKLNFVYQDYQVITITSNYIFLSKNKSQVKILKKDLISSFEYQKEK
jgi:hypothetical protein